MKLKVGMQFEDNFSQYITEIVGFGDTGLFDSQIVLIRFFDKQSGDEIDGADLGYWKEDNGDVAVFASLFDYMNFIGYRNEVIDLKHKLIHYIATQQFEQCCIVRDKLKELGELDTVVKDLILEKII